MRAAVLAVIVASTPACEKAPSGSAAATGSAAAQRSPNSSATDPWAGSGSSITGDTTACPDDVINKRMDDGFAVIKLYFGDMAKRIPRWTDCEVARKDLIELEPKAKTFEASVTEIKTWAESLGPACNARMKELGPQHPMAKDVEAEFKPLEPTIKEALARAAKIIPAFRKQRRAASAS